MLSLGKILPGDSFDDEYMVADIQRHSVTVVDLTYFHCLRWEMHDDGIRAFIRTTAREGRRIEPSATSSAAIPVTLYPPPDAVAQHLRRGRK